MTEGPVVKVNVNTSSLEELTAISGIGEGLAEKIIAGRPYVSLDDMTRVRGISARSVAGWEPLLAIETSDEALPVLEAEVVEEVEEVVEAEAVELEEIVYETIESEDEPVDADEAVEVISFDEEAIDEIPPVIEAVDDDLIPEPIPVEVDDAEIEETGEEAKPEERKKVKKEKDSKPLQRGDAFLLGGVVGVLSVLLAVVLTLGILALVNGGLDYVTPGQLNRMQREVQTIESTIDVLTQDIDGLTTRMDALESMGGRVADLEAMTEKMSEEAARMQAEMDGLQEAVAEMNEQVDALSEQYGIVESFLGGMQGLLNELLPEITTPAGE
jgi:uncharacterized protein YoxC